MTRRPLPWWSAHVAGLIVCQAAFWFGYWELAYHRSFTEDLYEATVVPLYGMLIISPYSFPVIGVVLGVISLPVRRPWRWASTVVVYALFAGCWCFAAHVLANLDI